MAIDDTPVATLGELRARVEAAGDRPVRVRYQRGGREETVTIAPRAGRLGVRFAPFRVEAVGLGRAVGLDAAAPFAAASEIVIGLYRTTARDAEVQLMGPVAVQEVVAEEMRADPARGVRLVGLLVIYVLLLLLPLDLGRVVFHLVKPAQCASPP